MFAFIYLPENSFQTFYFNLSNHLDFLVDLFLKNMKSVLQNRWFVRMYFLLNPVAVLLVGSRIVVVTEYLTCSNITLAANRVKRLPVASQL